jgi:hypothetical protein
LAGLPEFLITVSPVTACLILKARNRMNACEVVLGEAEMRFGREGRYVERAFRDRKERGMENGVVRYKLICDGGIWVEGPACR